MKIDRQTLEALLACAVKAGEIVLRHRDAGVTAERKADRSLVSAADREAEALILEVLREFSLDTPVIAEEESAAGRQQAAAERFWLVDPLDGTKEFLSGGDDFTVNIALIEAAAPVLGIVYTPAEGVLWWGDGKRGAWRARWPVGGRREEAERVACASCPPRPRAVASKSHATAETEAYLDACGAGERLSIGSSLKFLLLADGRADLYPRAAPTMEWDTAAGDAILRAAGGMTFDLDGAPLAYGKPYFFNPGFVATGGHGTAPLGLFYRNRQAAPGAH